MIVLYNTELSQIVAKLDRPYTVDGKPGVLPPNIVQLSVVDIPRPAMTADQRAIPTTRVELESRQWVKDWLIVDVDPAVPSPMDQWYAVVEAGYLDSTYGIRLKAQEYDRTLFAQLLTMLQSAASRSMITDETPVNFFDYNGTPQSLPFAQFEMLMISYGMWYAAHHATKPA